jgi:hypothetical protein
MRYQAFRRLEVSELAVRRGISEDEASLDLYNADSAGLSLDTGGGGGANAREASYYIAKDFAESEGVTLAKAAETLGLKKVPKANVPLKLKCMVPLESGEAPVFEGLEAIAIRFGDGDDSGFTSWE